MSRPADWYPLTEDGRDPIPGDWELVREAAARYRRTADAISRARTLLGEVTDSEEGWRSDAGTAFREKATELSGDIWKAHGRYDVAALALANYWPVLEDAQDESLSLRQQAITAQERIDAANSTMDGLDESRENQDLEGDDLTENEEAHGRAEGERGAAEGELASLKSRLNGLIEEKNRAAQSAADQIGEFIGGDGLEDGFWDRVGGALDVIRDVLITLGNIGGFIAAWAGLAALLVGWIPVIGQALAGILGVIALVGSIFSLVGNLLQGKWGMALLDVVGIVTFGLGRAAGSAARLGAQGSRFQAFRSLRGMSEFGNRAARTTRAADIMGDSAGNLRRLSDAAARGSRSSMFGGLGDDMARNFSALRNARMGDIMSQTRALPGQLAPAAPWSAT
ncbi:hypothetical protein [Streptomyces sp. SBT349]|uniref:hypothetical protein n=1 Tax=Streptomyces sp. SBT349 TaxID=1580539 RepID=UPI00066E2ECF|nr:hypothetical protein [Streptomyces sp. SBT349]